MAADHHPEISELLVEVWLWAPFWCRRSERSNRRVALTANVLQLLSGLKQLSTTGEGLLFENSEGNFFNPDYFDEYIFGPIRTKAELPRIAQGESPKYVSDQFGATRVFRSHSIPTGTYSRKPKPKPRRR